LLLVKNEMTRVVTCLQQFLITGFLHSSPDRETEWIEIFERRSSQLALLFCFKHVEEACGKALYCYTDLL